MEQNGPTPQPFYPTVTCTRLSGDSCGETEADNRLSIAAPVAFADGLMVTFGDAAALLKNTQYTVQLTAEKQGVPEGPVDLATLPTVTCTTTAGDSCGESAGGEARDAKLTFAAGVELAFAEGNFLEGAKYTVEVTAEKTDDPEPPGKHGDATQDFRVCEHQRAKRVANRPVAKIEVQHFRLRME